MTQRLDDILNSQAGIWRGSSNHRRKTAVLDTGFPALNKLLHAGGWPQSTHCEFYLPETGSGFGEIRLLLPALAKLCQHEQQKNLLWIAPPFIPFAPALLQQHIDIERLIIVRSKNSHDSLWAAEQALLSGVCKAVFTWTGGAYIGTRELRRLQLAAQQSHCWHILFRQHRCMHHPSPAPLRVHLQPDTMSQVQLDILKQPGGWGGQQCILSVGPHFEVWQRLPVELLPHYNDTPLPQINNRSQHTAAVKPTPLSRIKSTRHLHHRKTNNNAPTTQAH